VDVPDQNPVARRDEVDVVRNGLAVVGGDEHVIFRAADPAADQCRRRDLVEVALRRRARVWRHLRRQGGRLVHRNDRRGDRLRRRLCRGGVGLCRRLLCALVLGGLFLLGKDRLRGPWTRPGFVRHMLLTFSRAIGRSEGDGARIAAPDKVSVENVAFAAHPAGEVGELVAEKGLDLCVRVGQAAG
jgi:hypothetical protein